MFPRMRVATFNLYNLVLPGVPYYESDPYTPAEYQEKTIWIGRQLDRMAADIAGFQEVFHKPALQAALANSNRFQDVEPVVLATNEEESPAQTPAVGLASRFPVVSAESVTAFPPSAIILLPGAAGAPVTVPVSGFSHAVLKAQIAITAEITITAFVAHLKSKRPLYYEGESGENPLDRTLGAARSLVRRAAEAAALRALILEEIAANRRPVIVLGDLNDATLAVTTQMVAGEKPYFRWPQARKEPYWDTLLYSAQEIQARAATRDVYFTYIYNSFYEALDQIMVSEEFYRLNPDRIAEVYYVQLFNDHIIDAEQTYESAPRTMSDHGQVVAWLRGNS
ncbi:MAG: endonuclease/exonuclease/phosphatase family protein [Candidatus Promineifilaceae bacterium]